MADVSALPVQDWGNMMTSFGRGTAEQQQSQAQTGLIGQQTQAASMQNQLMRARMPLIMHALQDFNTDPHGGSDTSGESPPPTEGGAAPAGESPTQNSGVANWYDPARVDAGLRQRFFVNPGGTPQELQSIVRAGLVGDPGLLEAAKAQRELGVQQRVAQNQSEANGMYETMASVSNAPEGSALDALAAVSPQAAAKIKSLIPDGVEEDAAARQYASHIASTVHQYSGRKVTADTGGTFRDETTGEPVAGVPNAGMNQEQWTNLANHETELVPMKQSDGSETQVPRWQAEGNKSLQQGIMRAAAKGNIPGASPTISGAPRAQATAAATTAAATASKGPARAATPPVTSSAQLLPGVDLNSLPKVSLPPPVSGRTPNPVEQAKIDAFKENYKSVQTDAQRTLAETNQSDALLTPMQVKMNSVNPRDVGPGSAAYKALMDFKTAVTGKAPQDLVDMGILDKFANQLGVQNVRQLLSGQRITNQEMMNFLTRASASTTQPLDVMKAIISYQKANNDFDRKYSTTALAALGRGVDPGSISALQNGRTAFVQSAMDRDLGPAPVVKQLPTGARLQKYAETHFNGDQKAARAHLISQGYTE